MNFGSYVGQCLTSSDEFDASLTIAHKKPIPINFDNLELQSCIEGGQLCIRLGFKASLAPIMSCPLRLTRSR